MKTRKLYVLLKHLVLMLVAMWIGGFVSRALAGVGLTFPSYIGAMVVAAVIRNVDDLSGVFGLSQQTLDDLGNVALSLFLALALMTLRLWGACRPRRSADRHPDRPGRARGRGCRVCRSPIHGTGL